MRVPCPSCRKRLSQNATSCPNCGHPLPYGWAKAAKTKARSGCLFSLAMFVGMIVLLRYIGLELPSIKETPESRASLNCNGSSGEIAAFVASQSFVKPRLKAPSTSVFPYITSDGVTVSPTGSCKYAVLGYVDAQNGFGAQIRTRYVVETEFHAVENRWIMLSIHMK